MRNWRRLLGLAWLLCMVAPASAQINISIGAPTLDIGIHFSAFPAFTIVPGTPVYFAPRVSANLFFYDGLYWIYQNDTWYSSSWYNGPWAVVDPNIVPVYILQVPVRYYRRPPPSFRGWAVTAPPRWGERWGAAWEQRHAGWNQVNRAHIPPPAPVPTYQKQYTGKRYPTPQQQQVLHAKNYKYQPHEPVVQQHYHEHAAPPPHGQPEHRESEKGHK